MGEVIISSAPAASHALWADGAALGFDAARARAYLIAKSHKLGASRWLCFRS
jgi:hypothetical protein